jgi:FixJ family two-component response regulator
VFPIDQSATSDLPSRPEHWVGIVDDDASIRSSLARVLRLEGMCVETFGCAEDALDRIALGAPDCLVLDVHLGGLSGFDLQDRLLARGDAPPIIFITAHDEVPACRLSPHAGAAGYLRKPFDVAALITCVRPFFGATASVIDAH